MGRICPKADIFGLDPLQIGNIEVYSVQEERVKNKRKNILDMKTDTLSILQLNQLQLWFYGLLIWCEREISATGLHDEHVV